MAYSSINNSLEERFIELLLLIDGQKADFNPKERFSIDFSGILDALKDIAILKGKFKLCHLNC